MYVCVCMCVCVCACVRVCVNSSVLMWPCVASKSLSPLSRPSLSRHQQATRSALNEKELVKRSLDAEGKLVVALQKEVSGNCT
jgi:hypothetical protein